MHTVPDTTASGAHLVSGLAPCAPAVLASSTSIADVVMPILVLMVPTAFMIRPPCELGE